MTNATSTFVTDNRGYAPWVMKLWYKFIWKFDKYLFIITYVIKLDLPSLFAKKTCADVWLVHLFSCGHATLLEALFVRLSVRWSVSLLVPGDQYRKVGTTHFWCFRCDCLWVWVSKGWGRVWMGVVCPWPSVRNKIVTSRHLFLRHASTHID